MAVILDREALKWFRPAKGQFQIFYRWIGDHPEYQPGLCSRVRGCRSIWWKQKPETRWMIREVLAKKGAAVRWCVHQPRIMPGPTMVSLGNIS